MKQYKNGGFINSSRTFEKDNPEVTVPCQRRDKLFIGDSPTIYAADIASDLSGKPTVIAVNERISNNETHQHKH